MNPDTRVTALEPSQGRAAARHNIIMTSSTKSVLLEVAVASVDDAVAAQAGGADRLELNSALLLGGLTPSLGMLLEVKAAVTLPIMVMVRPRSGGFTYSHADFQVMRRDVDLALQHGADGIVFGILTEAGQVDTERCQQLLKQIGSCPAVFHRAFDVTPDPFTALQQVTELGFRRIMTSGQEENAYNGAARIAEVLHRAAGRIEILPAGGINRFTIADVLARTGCDQVHASLRQPRPDGSVQARPHVSFGGVIRLPEDRYDATNAGAVAGLHALLKPGAHPS